MRYYVKAECTFQVHFYDVDQMKVVYHGNYVNYFEMGRSALLDKINFNYAVMEETGYAFPVVDMRIKYMHSLRFHDTGRVVAYLTEYENCIKIKYEIFNAATGELCTKGETTQMCVRLADNATQYECPSLLLKRVQVAQDCPQE